jgi:hypothetical protein
MGTGAAGSRPLSVLLCLLLQDVVADPPLQQQLLPVRQVRLPGIIVRRRRLLHIFVTEGVSSSLSTTIVAGRYTLRGGGAMGTTTAPARTSPKGKGIRGCVVESIESREDNKAAYNLHPVPKCSKT